MDNDFFLDAGIPSLPHFDQPPMPTWHSLPPADVRFPAPATADGCSGCFFDSALSSMVSSPGSGSNSAISNEGIVLRELIGKLGNICNSGEISPPEHAPAPLPGVSPPYVSANNSCYNTPLSSPPKAGFFAHPVNSIGSSLPAMPGDSGFAERAARFSSFGSRSFNCRTTQFGLPNGSGSPSNAPTQLKPARKLQRVLSSPALKVENENEVKVNRFAGNCGVDQGEFRDNSSVPEQPHPDAENGPRPGNDVGSASRKRKYTPKGKSKQIPSSPAQSTQNGNDPSAKRIKPTQAKEGNNTANETPPEPPKDYIHVRARRGQATDSHSLAERLRREKISERMKLLQDIVPGCNKVTGKALMLEEIINYVQSLQRQVEFLSMKLASTPPSLDFSTSNSFHNDRFQPNCSLQTSSMHQLDTLSQNFYGAQNALQPNCIAENEVGPLNESHDMTLPPNDGFINGVHELQSLCEGDLHKIVEMGFSDCALYTG